MVVDRQEKGALMIPEEQGTAFLSRRHFLHVGNHGLTVKDNEEVLLCREKPSARKHSMQRSCA